MEPWKRQGDPHPASRWRPCSTLRGRAGLGEGTSLRDPDFLSIPCSAELGAGSSPRGSSRGVCVCGGGVGSTLASCPMTPMLRRVSAAKGSGVCGGDRGGQDLLSAH